MTSWGARFGGFPGPQALRSLSTESTESPRKGSSVSSRPGCRAGMARPQVSRPQDQLCSWKSAATSLGLFSHLDIKALNQVTYKAFPASLGSLKTWSKPGIVPTLPLDMFTFLCKMESASTLALPIAQGRGGCQWGG